MHRGGNQVIFSRYCLKANGGFVDKYGTVIIEPQFEGAWNAAEGLACVRITESTDTLTLLETGIPVNLKISMNFQKA